MGRQLNDPNPSLGLFRNLFKDINLSPKQSATHTSISSKSMLIYTHINSKLIYVSYISSELVTVFKNSQAL